MFVLGIVPPSPTPATVRITINHANVGATADPKPANARMDVNNNMVGRRPYVSATTPLEEERGKEKQKG